MQPWGLGHGRSGARFAVSTGLTLERVSLDGGDAAEHSAESKVGAAPPAASPRVESSVTPMMVLLSARESTHLWVCKHCYDADEEAGGQDTDCDVTGGKGGLRLAVGLAQEWVFLGGRHRPCGHGG